MKVIVDCIICFLGGFVDLLHRIMFWTDWGYRPKIETSNMDGTKRLTIVSSSLRWPNAITIGYQGQFCNDWAN